MGTLIFHLSSVGNGLKYQGVLHFLPSYIVHHTKHVLDPQRLHALLLPVNGPSDRPSHKNWGYRQYGNYLRTAYTLRVVKTIVKYIDHLKLGQAYQLDMKYKAAGALLSRLNSRWEKVNTSIRYRIIRMNIQILEVFPAARSRMIHSKTWSEFGTTRFLLYPASVFFATDFCKIDALFSQVVYISDGEEYGGK